MLVLSLGLGERRRGEMCGVRGIFGRGLDQRFGIGVLRASYTFGELFCGVARGAFGRWLCRRV